MPPRGGLLDGALDEAGMVIPFSWNPTRELVIAAKHIPDRRAKNSNRGRVRKVMTLGTMRFDIPVNIPPAEHP